MSSSIQAALCQFVQHARARPGLAAAAVGAALALSPAVVAGYRNYQLYLSIGPGGIPHNIVGWMIQGLAQLVATPTSQLADDGPLRHPNPQHAALYAGRGEVSYLGPSTPDNRSSSIGLRRGSRPVVPGFVAPQRQTSDWPPAGTRAAQDAFLHALAAANPQVLAIRPSQSEGVGTPALWRVTAPAYAAPPHRATMELCHAHGEGSSHMILSLPDARQVVAGGWGERHKLAGRTSAVAPKLPLTYLFVYAPRDEAEMAVWKRLVVATARFAAAGGPTGGAIVVPKEA